MQDGGDFGGSQGGSQKSPTTAKKRDAQTLVPLSIKQIEKVDHRDSKFKIDNKEISQITFVGVILSVEVQQTHINYMIDDGSGKINVRLYVDNDDDNHQRHAEKREGMYVRVIGNLRVFNNLPAVVAFQLIPLTDFNELTYHLLEVIHTHCVNTKEQAGASPSKAAVAPGAVPAAANSMSVDMGASNDDGGFSGLQKQVLDIFNQDTNSESGTSIQTVLDRLSPNGVSRNDIAKAIEFLSDEGHLYSTIDEEHYKSTTCG